MAIEEIYRGVDGNSSATFEIGDALTTAQQNDDWLDLNKAGIINTWVDIASTPALVGQTFILKQHTSGNLGGGTLVAVSGSVTDDGGTQKNSATSNVYLKRINYEFLASDMFGLNASISNMQNFLDAAEGKFAQLSPGTYTLSSKCTVKANTTLFCRGATVKMANGFTTTSSFFVADDGATIYDLTIDGNYANNTSHNVALCEIGNFSKYERCNFTKIPYIGLSPLSDGDTCYVYNCKFIADASTSATVGSYIGLWYDTANIVVYCDDCYFEGFRINAIFVGGYSVINNPKVFNCHKQTSPVGGGHIASGLNVKYCQINNPIIDGNGNAAASGIELDNYNMHVSGGFIRNCGFFGVIVQSGEGHSVSGVTCHDNGLTGIQCGSSSGSDVVRKFVLDGNTCYGNGTYGIVVDTNVGDNWVVSNNTCYGNTTSDTLQILRKTAASIVEGNMPLSSNLSAQTVSSEVALGSAFTLSASATTYNLTSISVPPGTWDIEFLACPISGGSTVTSAFNASISTTSATVPTAPANGASGLWRGNVTGDLVPWVRSFTRLSFTSTTTVYAVVRSTFTTSTQQCYGYIIAKRVY